jgi:acyl transferase domain-containing protein
VETHGTGTLLGDPIEIKALTQVYREYTRDKGYCAVGSVKSNMGHLIRAAAIPSFIKVMLTLKNKQIPPTLHCQKPHPRFRFDDSPFYPIIKCKDWKPPGGIRRAGISSFGFGGTNCHMIVQEFQDRENPNYVPRKRALPVTQFKRQRYWLGKEIENESDIKGIVTGRSQLDIIKELEQGKTTIAQVMELLNLG